MNLQGHFLYCNSLRWLTFTPLYSGSFQVISLHVYTGIMNINGLRTGADKGFTAADSEHFLPSTGDLRAIVLTCPSVYLSKEIQQQLRHKWTSKNFPTVSFFQYQWRVFMTYDVEYGFEMFLIIKPRLLYFIIHTFDK